MIRHCPDGQGRITHATGAADQTYNTLAEPMATCPWCALQGPPVDAGRAGPDRGMVPGRYIRPLPQTPSHGAPERGVRPARGMPADPIPLVPAFSTHMRMRISGHVQTHPGTDSGQWVWYN